MRTKYISPILRMIHTIPALESGIEIQREPLSRRQVATETQAEARTPLPFARLRPTPARPGRGEGESSAAFLRGADHGKVEAPQVARLRQFLVPAALSLALGAVVVLTGCARSQAQPKPVPPTVTVAPVEQQDIVEWDEFTGRTAPVDLVEGTATHLGAHPGSPF